MSKEPTEITAAEITGWVRATHGIALPERVAKLAAAELGAATARALAALETHGIEGEPSSFAAILNANADQEP
jgi:hypothetical protein